MSVDIGDEQIYWLRAYAPSERVRIAAIDTRKKTPRYEVVASGPFSVTSPRLSRARAVIR